jgi:3-methyladenine DNA glycosylase/8-oxoguanine DNA glycosylase
MTMNKFSFSVAVPQPFNFELTVRKPAGWDWGAPGEVWENHILYTAFNLNNDLPVGLKLHAERDDVAVDATVNRQLTAADRDRLIDRVQNGLGVQADLDGFYRLAKTDELVKHLITDLYGLRIGFLSGVFERSLLAITLQMAPLKRSMEMRQCLIDGYGHRMKVDGREVAMWPTARAAAKEQVLRERCRLGYRAKAIHRMAEQVIDGFPDIMELAAMDEETANKKLRTLYGIGEYSAGIVSPHRGFPLDVWSSRIFHEILFRTTPEDSRGAIDKVTKEAKRRWGRYAGHVFVYTLNDLPNLADRYPLTRLS